ncbi:maternal effect protein oskar [Hetaerina americana]|uniref:maternal effect protein oskar n=1 Tax=Hetaerina americana TaxID=62018 RepID=UPI003A7F2D7B
MNLHGGNSLTMAIRPMIFGHQLLGDSHMLNVAEMLGYQLDWIQPDSIGLCISGQTIIGLRRRLQNTLEINEKVILMIGNNEFQRGLDQETIKMNFLHLVEYLLGRVRKLVILTTVPSPEMIDGEAYRITSMGFNRWILSVNWWDLMQLSQPGRIAVVDVSSQFVNYHDGILEEYFQPSNKYNTNAPDGLSLNKYGIQLLLDTLEKNSHSLY